MGDRLIGLVNFSPGLPMMIERLHWVAQLVLEVLELSMAISVHSLAFIHLTYRCHPINLASLENPSMQID